MPDVQRTANLLGAASLALSDLSLGEARRASGLSASSTAALTSLRADPGLSVSELGRRVGLSQPAAARMVDALDADGLVERVPSSAHRRLTSVRLTSQGDRLAQSQLTRRSAPLTAAVAALEETEQEALTGLLEKILTRIHDEVGQGQRICRLCDRTSCIRSAPCPVGRAERAAET